MRRAAIIWLLALSLTLSGCGDRLLERSYSSATPHSAVYWENGDADTLRAESYQELVTALMLLIGEHAEDGVVRVYGEHADTSEMTDRACVEVQQETALGAYLLDYMTYGGEAVNDYYELTVRFGYRRTAEEQSAIVNATSTEAIPDLLRAAAEEGSAALAIRVGYFATDRAGVLRMVAAIRDEFFPPEPPDEPAPGESPEPPDGEALDGNVPPQPPDATPSADAEAPPDSPPDGEGAERLPDVSPWRVCFYPDGEQPGIVEVVLTPPEEISDNELEKAPDAQAPDAFLF